MSLGAGLPGISAVVNFFKYKGGGDPMTYPTDATYAAGDVGGAVGGDACNAVVLVGLYDDANCENLVFSYKGRPERATMNEGEIYRKITG